jgi:hypothetical protein
MNRTINAATAGKLCVCCIDDSIRSLFDDNLPLQNKDLGIVDFSATNLPREIEMAEKAKVRRWTVTCLEHRSYL